MQSVYLTSYLQDKFVNESDSFKYKRIGTLPALPITALEMQAQVRIDVLLEQQSYINLIIASAVRYAEEYMNLSLINTQWLTYGDNFDANAFELRKGYFVTLDSFEYVSITAGNILVDVDPTIFQVADKSFYAQILMRNGKTFPFNDLVNEDNAITIKFTSGMAANSSEFAAQYPDLKMALLQHCAFLYDNRGNTMSDKEYTNKIPAGVLEVYERYKAPAIFSGGIYNTL